MKRTKTKSIFGALCLFFAISLFSVFCSISFNTISVSAYSASISTSNSVTLDATINGTGTSIKAEAINIQTDCRAGYNLNIATPNGSNLYLNGNNSENASFTAVDGTSALSSSNNTNKWGYTLASNPTSSTVFLPLSANTSVLKTPAQTASPNSNINDTFNINYGVHTDETITPGAYRMGNNGTIVYYLTMDPLCNVFTAAFNANGGTGTVANQNIQPGVSTKLNSADTLTAPTGGSYTDAGNNTITGDPDKLWTFWGWNTSIDGTGDWYKDKEAVTDLTTSGNTITLYAQWKQATLADLVAGTPSGTEKVIDHNLMQDMSPETCWNSPITTAANAPAATLLDYRGKVTTGSNPEQPEQYNVSKLADGLCWMTTNLNLGRTSGGPNGNGTITLTSDDTDLAANTTFTLPAGDTTSYTSTTRLAKIRVTNNSGTNANGVYYTWSAAVANTNSISTNPTTSICPKNWDLPTNENYTNLNSKSSYSSTNSPTNAPSSFLATGKFTNGASFYPISPDSGFYWSSSSSSTTAAYGATITSSALSTSASTGSTSGGNKYYRKNIRCVASLGRITINYEGNGTAQYPVTGSVASQTNVEITSTNAQSGSGFVRTGWALNSWNTEPDGSGASIAANASIASLNPKPGETITLYAQWSPQYTITYVNNCMSWASANASCTQVVSDGTGTQKINLNANGYGSGTLGSSNYNSWSLTDWRIVGWNTKPDGTGTEYQVSSIYTITGQYIPDGITLYAHWSGLYYVSFNANESSVGSTPGSATGNMTKQTIVRDVATAIKTNTFALSGYILRGWNTRDDGTGILYGDGQKITNLTTTGNTITLYAIWVRGALLNTGSNVNQKFKRLAGNSSASYTTQDTAITAIVRSNNLPNDFTPSTANTISDSSSPLPIYAWYDSTNTTIYYYSEAANIIMNKNSSYFFYQMRALSDLSTISTWDTIKVTTMDAMFYCAGYNATTFTIDLSPWNTSSVTNMNSMFRNAGYGATTWSVGNLSSWNTSSVTDMENMFAYAGYNATTFTIDLSSWDTSNVTKMDGMFSSTGRSATTWSVGGLSSWNTSSVTDMSYMFSNAGYNASAFTLDLSSWNASKVTNMSYMFSNAGYNASAFTLDLSSWNASKVTNMSYMFSNAGHNASAFTLDLSSWNASKVTNMSHMFTSAGYNATTFTLDLSYWDTSSVTNMESMFSSTGYSATIFTLDFSSWDTSKVTDMSSMFYNAGHDAATFTLDLSSFNTSHVGAMHNMFAYAGYSATTWSIGDLSSWNMSNAGTLYNMFAYAGYSASTFTLNLSSWDIGGSNTDSMFRCAGYDATTFTLDLSSWNISALTKMSYTFYYAGYNATTFTLDLSSWDTSNVTDMQGIFTSTGYNATTWSVTIPKTNNGTTTGPIANTTSRLYGKTTSVYTNPAGNKSFTLAN